LTWRAEIAPLIRRSLEDTQELPYLVRRRRLRQLYPLIEGGRVPSYRLRIWQDEVRRQLGHKKKRKGLREEKQQGDLFGMKPAIIELRPR
jgi:hypothetical protein